VEQQSNRACRSRYPLQVLARPPLQHAIAAALAALLLAACGDGGAQPQSLPPLTQSPTPASSRATVTATATAQALEKSAAQFIRAYFKAFDQANHTSDPSVLTQLYYERMCTPCRDDVAVIEAERQRGQRVEGYEFVVHEVVVDSANATSAVVNVVVHHKAGRVVRNSDGTVVDELKATRPVQSLFDLRRAGTGWRITKITSLGVATP
jgi:hypothetical protein